MSVITTASIDFVGTSKPTIITGDASGISERSATIKGQLISVGNVSMKSKKLYLYSTDPTADPKAIMAEFTNADLTVGEYSQTINNLKPGTTYYYRAYAANDNGETWGEVKTFTTAQVSLKASPDKDLEESTLNGRKIVLSLTGTQFVPAFVKPNSILLQNAPAGLTISSVSGVSSNSCTLSLAYDGLADFDTDYAKFCAQVQGSLMQSGYTLTTDPIIIKAVNDKETITLSNDTSDGSQGVISEGQENGKGLIVKISGGYFKEPLAKYINGRKTLLLSGNWTVSNLPTGVTVGGIYYVDRGTARIVLSGNSQEDLSNDIANISVTVPQTDFMDSTGDSSLFAGTGALITATSAPTLSTVVPADAKAFYAKLSGKITSDGKLAIIERGFELASDKAAFTDPTRGAEIRKIASIDTTNDFSEEALGLSPKSTYYFRAYGRNWQGVSYGEISMFRTGSVDVMALPIEELREEILDKSVIEFNIDGTTFDDLNATWNSFSLVNAPAGLTINKVDFSDDDTKASIELSFKDYDIDMLVKNLAVKITTSVGGQTFTFVSDPMLIEAANDDEILTISNKDKIIEGSENGGVIILDLAGGIFSPTLSARDIKTTNLPAGVSVRSVRRVSSTEAALTLGGNSTSPYDGDITNFSVNVLPSGYSDSTGTKGITADSGVAFTAKAIPVVLTEEPSSVTDNSAIILGTILNDGNDNIIEKGFVYSIVDAEPRVGKGTSVVITDTGTGMEKIMLRLKKNTTYYYRAYATNSKGTGYGKTELFTTGQTVEKQEEPMVLVPATQVTVGQSFTFLVGGGDDIDDGFQANGITVINKDRNDGYIIIKGVFDTQGYVVVKLKNKMIFFDVIPPLEEGEADGSFE